MMELALAMALAASELTLEAPAERTDSTWLARVDTADSAASRSDDALLGSGTNTGTVVRIVGRRSSAAAAAEASTAEAAEATRESIGVTEAAMAAFSDFLSVSGGDWKKNEWLTRCKSH